MIPLINYFINEPPQSCAHQSQSLHTVVTCAPEPITAELKPMTTSGFIPAVARAGPGFCRRFGPVLCILTDCCGLMRLKESGPSLFRSEEIRRRADNKVESESVDVRV